MSKVIILNECGPTTEAFNRVYSALEHARAKHPLFPVEPCAQYLILSEEVMEVAKEVNELTFLGKKDFSHYKEELAQVASCCIRALVSIEHLEGARIAAVSPMQMAEQGQETGNPYAQL